MAGPRKLFTVPEVLVTFIVMVGVAALVISIAPSHGHGGPAAARARAAMEIKVLTVAIEGYHTDYGTVPRNSDTDELDARTDLNSYESKPSGKRYTRASKHLYRELSGDREPAESPDGVPEVDAKCYYSFPRRAVSAVQDSSGKVTGVRYIMDPYGNSYGYSTAGLAMRAAQEKVPRANGASPAAVRGYNTTTFDLWSTAGDRERVWVKNWP